VHKCRTTLAVVLVAFFLPIASAQESFGREVETGLALDELGVEDISRLFTRDFRPLVGATNSVLGDLANVRVRQQGCMSPELREVTTQAEVSANAGVWGFDVGLDGERGPRVPPRRRADRAAHARRWARDPAHLRDETISGAMRFRTRSPV